MAKSLKQAYDYWQNQPDLNCVTTCVVLAPRAQEKETCKHTHTLRIDDQCCILLYF